MCRNIRNLYNFDPPATEEEIRNAALQFIRKVSGSARPSRRNAAAFDQAVTDVSAAVGLLMQSLETSQPPRNREAEARKARQRAAVRFAGSQSS